MGLLDPNVNFEPPFALAYPFIWALAEGVLEKLRPSNEKLVQSPASEFEELSEVVPSKRTRDLLNSFSG